jgi:hypothetical protein
LTQEVGREPIDVVWGTCTVSHLVVLCCEVPQVLHFQQYQKEYAIQIAKGEYPEGFFIFQQSNLLIDIFYYKMSYDVKSQSFSLIAPPGNPSIGQHSIINAALTENDDDILDDEEQEMIDDDDE